MTMLREDRRLDRTVRPLRMTMEWTVGVIGAITAAIGLWMYYGPSNGVLSFFGWDFDVATLAEGWPLAVTIIGAALVSLAFGSVTRKLYFRDGEVVGTGLAALAISLIAGVGALAYLAIWIF